MPNPHRGMTLVPVLVIIAGLAAFFAASYFVVYSSRSSTRTVRTTNVTSAVDLNQNVNVAVVTNANENANVTVALEPAGYDAPEAPFTVADSKTLAVAFRRSTDKLVTRLAKVNAATGKTITTVELSTTQIQQSLGLTELPPAPSQFQFGRDGDSIVFLMSSATGTNPFIGIYRTSLATPTTVETVVQYDRNNLFNNDLPTISEILFNAPTNQVAFVIRGESGVNNNYVKIVNLKDKTVRDLKSYTTAPRLVGFPGNGSSLEVLYTDDEQYRDPPKGKWSYDQIRLSDGKVAATKLLLDEGSLSPPRDVYPSPDSISPNNTLFVFSSYSQEKRQSVLVVHNVQTGKLNEKSIDKFYGDNPSAWSPDSGKLLVRTGDGGVIYDLAKGAVDTIKEFSYAVLWYPGSLIIYANNQGDLYSYSPSVKKAVELEGISGIQGYGGDGYGGPGGGRLGINWVNR
ncbi:MAG: hypothetical protein HY567_04355 [Candidatus Kerfeldbacteria bacterium]|nr:hypothetical protein [Candidatus Kerfeldbacteria bacterium]